MGWEERGVGERVREFRRRNWRERESSLDGIGRGRQKEVSNLNSAGEVGKMTIRFKFGDGQIRWATSCREKIGVRVKEVRAPSDIQS